ncbi:NADH-cytochrome b5 reductase [Conglomerata obtusa]
MQIAKFVLFLDSVNFGLLPKRPYNNLNPLIMDKTDITFDYILTYRKYINHNTYIIHLKPVGTIPQFKTSSFVYIYDQTTKRPYTPIFVNENYLEFAIKKYPHGNLSNFLADIGIGSIVKLSNPINKREYKVGEFKDVLLIAGGTGITPMLQILETDSQTNFLLLFCNLSRDDIFLEDRLRKYSERVKVFHIIENIDDKFDKESTPKNIIGGRITKEIINDLAFIEDEFLFDFVYVCGPPGFMEVVCGNKTVTKEQGALKGILKDVGLLEKQVYKF